MQRIGLKKTKHTGCRSREATGKSMTAINFSYIALLSCTTQIAGNQFRSLCFEVLFNTVRFQVTQVRQ